MCRPEIVTNDTATTSSSSSSSTPTSATRRTTRMVNTDRSSSPSSVSSSSSHRSHHSTPGSSSYRTTNKSIPDSLKIHPLAPPSRVSSTRKSTRSVIGSTGSRTSTNGSSCSYRQSPHESTSFFSSLSSFSLSNISLPSMQHSWHTFTSFVSSTKSYMMNMKHSKKQYMMEQLQNCLLVTLFVSWMMYYILSNNTTSSLLSSSSSSDSSSFLRGSSSITASNPTTADGAAVHHHSKYTLDLSSIAASAAAVDAEQRAVNLLMKHGSDLGIVTSPRQQNLDGDSSHSIFNVATGGDVGKATIVQHNVTLSDYINVTVLLEKRIRYDDDDYVTNIPSQFIETDRELYSFNHSIRAPFPRWDFTTPLASTQRKDGTMVTEEEAIGSYKVSIMDSIIDFIQQQTEYYSTYAPPSDPDEEHEYLYSFGKKNKIHTSDHLKSYTPGNWFPEMVYVIDGRHRQIMAPHGVVMTEPFTIYSSDFTKRISDVESEATKYKISPTEKLMKMALHLLNHHKTNEVQMKWPRLYQLLMVEHGSFPFLAHYSDYIGCNYHNWNHHTESIPLFTVAANVKCNHTFPFPTFQTLLNSRNGPDTWANEIAQKAQRYPAWKDRIAKVVWRGALTGHLPKDIAKRAPRWHLTKLVHDEMALTESQRSLFDVKLTQIPDNVYQPYIHEEELGGVDHEKNSMPIDDFNHYRAVLDVDGHSWSNRFSDLFCGKSVILKMEPDYVDYFYYPINTSSSSPHLTAWKHYIPVKKDFSDLVEKAAWAVDEKNEEAIAKIVANANEWCMNGFNTIKAANDVLDIWEEYIRVLDQSSLLKAVTKTTSNDDPKQTKLQLQEILTQHDPMAAHDAAAGSISATNGLAVTVRKLDRTNSWENDWSKLRDDVLIGPLQMSPVKKSKNYWK